MIGLLKRLVSGEKKEGVSRVLEFDEAEPFFRANGVDINTIGFPEVRFRKAIPTEAYAVWFEDVRATPLKIDEKVITRITGRECARAVAGGQDSSGQYKPGSPFEYQFTIQDGKLELRGPGYYSGKRRL